MKGVLKRQAQTGPLGESRPASPLIGQTRSTYNTHVHTGKNTALAVSVWETLLHGHCPARPS